MEEPKTPEGKALKEAWKAVGGQSELARLLGLRSQGSISGWIARGKVPPERVIAVEEVSGVPRTRLRPDLYPPIRRPSTATRKSLGR